MLPFTRLNKYIHHINHLYKKFAHEKYRNEKMVLINCLQYYGFIITSYRPGRHALDFILRIGIVYYLITVYIFNEKIDRLEFSITTKKFKYMNGILDRHYYVSISYYNTKICHVRITTNIHRKETPEKSIISRNNIVLTNENYRTDMFDGIYKKISDNNNLVFHPTYYKILRTL